MKTNPMYKKHSNLLSQKEQQKLLIKSAQEANLLISLTVLHDVFDFGPDQLEKYIDSCNTLSESITDYNGLDDWKNINAAFLDTYGIKIV